MGIGNIDKRSISKRSKTGRIYKVYFNGDIYNLETDRLIDKIVNDEHIDYVFNNKFNKNFLDRLLITQPQSIQKLIVRDEELKNEKK